jgi:acylpyruvate hydrolase
MIGYNTFLPLSKFIPKEKIPDPHDVRLELQVNGEVRQNGSTNLMLFKIPELFEAVSNVMTMSKWDILLSIFSPFRIKY